MGGAQVSIRPCAEFTENDYVVYPCLYLTDSGKATALVLLRRVGDYDYGGSYCEFVDGRWRPAWAEPQSECRVQ